MCHLLILFKEMKGTVKRITPFGDLIMYLFRLETGKYGRTYTGKKYRNYAAWKDLKVDDLIDGLQWKDEKRGIIDADSPMYIVHDALL